MEPNTEGVVCNVNDIRNGGFIGDIIMDSHILMQIVSDNEYSVFVELKKFRNFFSFTILLYCTTGTFVIRMC